MNKVILIGRLTRDPEVKYTQGSEPIAVARFSVAIDHGYGDNKKTYYPNCIAFRKTAEVIEKYVLKGHRVGIEGHIQTGSYEKQDGTKVYTTDVVVDNLEFLESKNSEASAPKEDVPEGFARVDDDEGLPF